jgi:pyrroloquinoline-quinone synthase
MTMPSGEQWDRETFIARLQEAGEGKGKNGHSLLADIEAGSATPAAVKRWIAGRYYYQTLLPRQDALITANCPVRDVRRAWVERIMEHDGRRADQGGIGAWLQLGEAAGVTRRDLEEHRNLPQAARETVDEQLELVERSSWQAAIAATLVDLVAPDLLREPATAFEKHYSWIEKAGLGYFKSRAVQAARHAAQALDFTVRYCDTPSLQREAVRVLERKCDLLFAMLDAVEGRGGEQGRPEARPAAARA